MGKEVLKTAVRTSTKSDYGIPSGMRYVAGILTTRDGYESVLSVVILPEKASRVEVASAKAKAINRARIHMTPAITRTESEERSSGR